MILQTQSQTDRQADRQTDRQTDNARTSLAELTATTYRPRDRGISR